ncbi:MAG: hypothetical protein L3J24_02645 [Xanthomonadales bacterium]|nr:hypothetical protein [Xanthomonadales bacterium]
MAKLSNYLLDFSAVSLALVLFLMSQPAQAGWQPFTLTNGHLLIDVEIDGHLAQAMLDSGAALNLISPEST